MFILSGYVLSGNVLSGLFCSVYFVRFFFVQVSFVLAPYSIAVVLKVFVARTLHTVTKKAIYAVQYIFVYTELT